MIDPVAIFYSGMSSADTLLASQSNALAWIMVAAHIAAALALYNGILTTIGQAKVACSALEGIARNPEAKGAMSTALFVGIGAAETSGVYGFVISFLILFMNPLVNTFVSTIMNL